ncbi:ESX secretion-associated protein EspG [Nocardia sp. X0981]
MGRPIRTWNFDYLEFAVRWNGLTGESLPEPLVITTNFGSNHDYLRECRRIAAAVAVDDDPELDTVFTALTQPDIVLAVFGLTAPDTGDEQAIRIYATSSGDRCFVVDQRPGESIYHAAGFTLSEHDSINWVSDIVARLPARGPGQQVMVPLPDPDEPHAGAEKMDYSYGRSDFRDTFDDQDTEDHSEFLGKPLAGVGSIDIVQGRSVFGPAGQGRRALGWRDIAGDGRYTIAYRSPYVARATDTASFVTRLAEEVEEIQLLVDDERRSVCR